MAAFSPCVKTARRRLWHVVTGPLTRKKYLDFVERSIASGKRAPIHVQLKYLGVVTCGVVCDTREGASRPVDFYSVKTDIFGTVWVPHTAVRMCGGDPRCTCEAERSRGGAPVSVARRGASATAPLGNTGVTA